MVQYIIPVLAMSLLCAGWVMVQFLARRIGTKNHFDNPPRCGGCTCSGQCDRESARVSGR